MGLVIGLLDSGTGFAVGAVLAGSGFVLVMIGLGYRLDAGNIRKGLEGEQSVASELSYLNDEFLLLNDVMLPGARGISTMFWLGRLASLSSRRRITRESMCAMETDGS